MWHSLRLTWNEMFCAVGPIVKEPPSPPSRADVHETRLVQCGCTAMSLVLTRYVVVMYNWSYTTVESAHHPFSTLGFSTRHLRPPFIVGAGLRVRQWLPWRYVEAAYSPHGFHGKVRAVLVGRWCSSHCPCRCKWTPHHVYQWGLISYSCLVAM